MGNDCEFILAPPKYETIYGLIIRVHSYLLSFLSNYSENIVCGITHEKALPFSKKKYVNKLKAT